MGKDFFDSFEDLKIQVHGVRLPQIKISDEQRKTNNIPADLNNIEILKFLCDSTMKEKGIEKDEIYLTRLNRELNLINELFFTDYFLLVWDVINFCNLKEIPYGKGRGSAAGSLVMYLTKVTGIDPIENDLLFERFISKARAKSQIVDGIVYIDGSLAPDVDMDFCTDRRVEVVEYLKNKYAGKFCKLPTISTLASRACIKDVGKISENISEDELIVATKQIPVRFGKPAAIEDAIKESENFKQFADQYPGVIEKSKTIEGLMRQKGSHASAYLVCYDFLDDFLPVELDQEGEIVSSYDMNYAQEESIKLDLLGLHGVTLIDRLKKSLNNNLEDFDPNDPFIYKNGKLGDLPYGLFQLSGDLNYSTFKKVAPKNWSELSDVISLARPGAMAYVDDYISNNGNSYWGSKKTEEILSKTHNIPIYQEQTLAIANQVFGLSLEEGESLRRCVAKKKVKEVEQWLVRIEEQRIKLSLPKELAEFYHDVLVANGNYGFNKSHAAAYSYLSALTLYLKYKHPQEFYTECLKMVVEKADSQEHIAKIQQELRFFNIELLPPDLIKSKMDFSIEGKDIRYGFTSIKGVAAKSLDALQSFLSAEKSNKFEIFNAAGQNKLNIGILCALIQAGLMSSISANREKMVYEAQVWNLLTDREQTYCMERGEEYDFDLFTMLKNIEFWLNEKGKPLTRKGRIDTIRSKAEKYTQIYNHNRKHASFASWWYERKLLGYSYSYRLRNVFNSKDHVLLSAEEIKNSAEKEKVKGVFEVCEAKKGVAKSGNKYLKLSLRDETANFDAMILGDKYENFAREEAEPKEGDIVFIVGSASPQIVWLDNMKGQSSKIYMKLSDLR